MASKNDQSGSAGPDDSPNGDRPLWDESARLAALQSYGILDTPREPGFDDIVRLAADVFSAPIAIVNLIAEGRQWFKAEVGIGADEVPLDVSICAHAILQGGVLVVPDLRDDPRFLCNPLVAGETGLRFYAGAVLETLDGLPIGTVCILDTKPRPEGITDRQRLTLEVLARQVMNDLELRRAIAQRDVEVQRARASEDRLRLIVDSASDYAIITMDPERRVTDWSRGAEAIFGRSAEEMIGQPADLIFTVEDQASNQPQLEVGTAAAEGYAPDVRWHQRADGSLAFINGSVHPLPRDEHGRERGFIKIGRDETKQRADRAAILESEARFRNMADTLEQRVAEEISERAKAEEQLRQAQKMEAVGQLTGGVAHDFNNLLTVIRGSIDLLRRPGLSEERRQRYTDAIADTADRATKLTNQLLAFARRQALKPEIFDAVESIRAVRDMVGTLTGSRISITLDLRAEPCFVNADRSQFDTAIVNMAVNARDAMEGEGELTIKVDWVPGMPANRSHPFVAGKFATIALTDTGLGISKGALNRIFEPFFTTKGVGQGTGLGLSQVFGFANQSGGDIRAQSVEGQGSAFTLYLPLVDAPPEADNDPVPRGVTLGEGACILVVDDNVEVGSFATNALSELGYKTVLAMDGVQALARLAAGNNGFDAVFTDVMMPGMSGIELGQEIRRLYPGLPVILTSGYSSVLAENGTHGFELLHKPYSIEELSRLLKKVASTRSGRSLDS
jgi:PAS domain S-box-containing protein